MFCRICSTVLILVLSSFASISLSEPTTRPTQSSPTHARQQPQVQPHIEVYFSPDGGCTEAVVKQINSARSSIDIQAYSFTSAPIAKAVADAHSRGVKVRAVLDKSQRTARYTSATYLFNHGVPTFIDDRHAIAHNKIMIIDGATIITGSFNFTQAAEKSNAENLLIIHGYPQLVAEYEVNFEEHLGHAKRYEGAAGTGSDQDSPR